jgi:hypothetical protein
VPDEKTCLMYLDLANGWRDMAEQVRDAAMAATHC